MGGTFYESIIVVCTLKTGLPRVKIGLVLFLEAKGKYLTTKE